MTLAFFVGGFILGAAGATSLWALYTLLRDQAPPPSAGFALLLPFMVVTGWLVVYGQADREWWALALALVPGAVAGFLSLTAFRAPLAG
ncbi:hypothetical protein EON82_05150 [bacterium]|nr:MAG: hypothetical protein EON82_05150 [bacterium]